MSAGTKPGYAIGRNEDGLTTRERQVLGQIAEGKTALQASQEIGVTKQRVDQILKALEKKGRLQRHGTTWTITIPKP